MAKNNTKAAPMAATTNNTSNVSFASLKAENEQLKVQAMEMQNLAQIAAGRLLQAESLLSPQLVRKPNFWNILFHFKEVINIIQEVIKIIQEFKAQHIRQGQPNNDAPK